MLEGCRDSGKGGRDNSKYSVRGEEGGVRS